MHESRKLEAERDATLLGNARADITRCFERIERELEGKEYLAKSFSLADIAYMSNFDLLDRFQITVDPKFKNSIAWMNRLKARPSFTASAT
jgi:glutathione S-transferase